MNRNASSPKRSRRWAGAAVLATAVTVGGAPAVGAASPVRAVGTPSPTEMSAGMGAATSRAPCPEPGEPIPQALAAECPSLPTGTGASAPEVEAPQVEVPEAAAPEVEVPDVAEVEAPEVEVPEVEVPEVEIPEVEIPEVEVPEVELPREEAPEPEQRPEPDDEAEARPGSRVAPAPSPLEAARAAGIPLAPTRDYGAMFAAAPDPLPAGLAGLAAIGGPVGTSAAFAPSGLARPGPLRAVSGTTDTDRPTTTSVVRPLRLDAASGPGTPTLISTLGVAGLLALAVRAAIIRRSRRTGPPTGPGP